MAYETCNKGTRKERMSTEEKHRPDDNKKNNAPPSPEEVHRSET